MSKGVKGYLLLFLLFLSTISVIIWYSLDVPVKANADKTEKPSANVKKPPKAEAKPEDFSLAAKMAGANEAGLIPILVYHLIGEKEGRWTRTPENFRKDLEDLYKRNFVLIPLNDYLSGNINVPVGKSPAVITFDDSTEGQFRLIEKDGQQVVDPQSAVGILRDFGASHPEFGHAATFFVNAVPFGQPVSWQKKLQLLQEWGFEIGNHTYGHQNLGGLPSDQVADQITRLQEQIEVAVPGYKPKSFAIVQDGIPSNYDSLISGELNGQQYKHEGILMWAWSAAQSPFHKDYNPKRIQRIQAFEDNGVSSVETWLDRISAKKYVSDGKRENLSVPTGWEEVLRANHGKKVVTYQPDHPETTPAKDKQAKEARGIHVTFSYASSTDRWQKILLYIEKNNMNTVELDVKDESGRIGYLSQVPMAVETGAGRNMMPIQEMLTELKGRGIYSVARIVIFRDPYLAQKKPQLMVKSGGAPLGGGVWVSPFSQEVWEYNVELAREAYELGFDEVQFDYIRFPEGLAARTADYAGQDNRERVDVIADFLKYARNKVGWERIMSATIFGFAGIALDDVGIGQRPERMAPYLDYLSPMVYPSHFGPGNYGFANPNAHPYEVIDESMQDFQELVDVSGCELRPWLQAFTYGKPAYGLRDVQAQIKAAEENGIKTWLLWNAGVNYPQDLNG